MLVIPNLSCLIFHKIIKVQMFCLYRHQF